MNDLSSSEPIETPLQTGEAPGKDALLQEIGRKLSQARESAGESLEEAVRKLKLQKRHLLALEQGDWNNMPDDVYMLGFLRQYGQYLHVDLAAEIERLKHDQYALTKPLTFPDPPVAPSRRWAWLAGIAFALLFILFNISTQNSRIEDSDLVSASQAPSTEQLSSDSISSLQPSNLLSSEINQPHPNKSEESAGTSLAEADITPAISPPPPSSSPAAAHTTDMQKPAESSPSGQTTTVEPAGAIPNKFVIHHFRFDAVNSPVWLRISMPDPATAGKGTLLKEVMLQPGFHTSVNEKTTVLWITCGNAPALRIYVDGHIYADTGTLSAGKKVLRDFRFQINKH